ncbi:hypothetical protein pb186bvf_007703 [Paramecium bursaria]
MFSSIEKNQIVAQNMIQFLIKRFRMCKIQTQVIIFQCVVILLFIIFWGLILLLFLYFYRQIFNEGLFRKFVGQIFQWGQQCYKLLIVFKQAKIYLHDKLQFCYGVYGNQSKDMSIINKFASLENIMLPIYFNQPLDNLAIISMDSDQYLYKLKIIFIAQYIGQYTPQMNQTIIKVINQVRKNQQYIVYQSDGTNGYSIFIIPNTNISLFGKINVDRIGLKSIVNNKFNYDVKSYLIQMDGKIILGNVIRNQVGTFYFNNTKLTGFNQSSQDIIQKFIVNNTNPISNTCADLIEKRLFCLRDANNDEQIIAGRQITNNSYVLFILGTKRVNQIRADLQEQFESFFYQSIKFYAFLIGASSFLCFLIEYYLLWKLNHQINNLQNIVYSQIRGNSYIKNLIIFKNSQSQIQQLSDAYQNLINLRTRKTHTIPKCLNSNKYKAYPSSGLISQFNINLIVNEIKYRIKKLG